MTEICPKFQRVIWQYDAENRVIKVARLSCDMWSCPVCSKKLQKMWRAHLRKQLPKIGVDWRLVTLTVAQDVTSYVDSYAALSRGIDRLFKRIRRACSKWGKISYVRVYERHNQRIALHAHLIVHGLPDYFRLEKSRNGKVRFLPTNFRKGKRGTWALRTFIKKSSIEVGMGYIADVKRLPTDAALMYATKYLTKAEQDIGILGLRHVQTTQDIGSPERKKDKTWYVGYRLNKSDLIGGFRVLDKDTGEIIPDEYWKDGNVYPPLI